MKFVSGKELIAELCMEPFELIDYVEQKVFKPYDSKTGRVIRTKTENECWLEVYQNELEFITKPYHDKEIPDRINYHGSSKRFLRTILWSDLWSDLTPIGPQKLFL